ncbi:hypothetical protein WJX79_003025 [Trebouxia sp. C0005]
MLSPRLSPVFPPVIDWKQRKRTTAFGQPWLVRRQGAYRHREAAELTCCGGVGNQVAEYYKMTSPSADQAVKVLQQNWDLGEGAGQAEGSGSLQRIHRSLPRICR